MHRSFPFPSCFCRSQKPLFAVLALAVLTYPGLGLSGSETEFAPDIKESFRHQPVSHCSPDNVPSPDRISLGKTLFFDPRLSQSSTISCASCHNPGFSWGDGLPKAVGVAAKPLGRRTPTVLNVAFAELLFWDGRAETLEEQALGPIASTGEMNLPLPELVERLKKIPAYTTLFDAAYPRQGISAVTVGRALASFERTLISEPAPFDRWVAGDEEAIPASAKRGFALFVGKANCVKCHSGWNFTDNGFHDIGLAGEDRGRGVQLPQIEMMDHAFKTPTLRNIDRRAPYMHDGSAHDLNDVMALYNTGGVVKRPGLADEIKPLALTSAEQEELCNFLHTLTSPERPVEIPALPVL